MSDDDGEGTFGTAPDPGGTFGEAPPKQPTPAQPSTPARTGLAAPGMIIGLGIGALVVLAVIVAFLGR